MEAEGGAAAAVASSVVAAVAAKNVPLTQSGARARLASEIDAAEPQFPFPSLYRSLVYLQYDNPRTLKELACLGIR